MTNNLLVIRGCLSRARMHPHLQIPQIAGVHLTNCRSDELWKVMERLKSFEKFERTVTFNCKIYAVQRCSNSKPVTNSDSLFLTRRTKRTRTGILKLNKLNILLIRRWLIKKEEVLSKILCASFGNKRILSTKMH